MLTSNRAAAVDRRLGRPGRRHRRPRRRCSCRTSSPPIWPPTARSARPRRVDYTYHRPDGRDIELGVSAAPLPLAGGERGVIFTFQDVTDIKGLERTAQMRQRLAAVGEMAAGIAHEIRNPLASMSGAMQVLRGELPLSAEQAHADGHRAARVRPAELDDLVVPGLCPARAGEVDPRRRPAGRPGRRGAAEQQPRDRRATTSSRSTCRPNRCGSTPTRTSCGRSSGTWPPTASRRCPTAAICSCSSRVEDGQALLGVRDEGTGIPPEEVDAIFHPFRGSFGRGTGLGLAIVHRIVTDYNGRIDVQSAVGRGTTIVVKFPAPRRPASAAAAGEETDRDHGCRPPAQAAHPGGRRRAVAARDAVDRPRPRGLRRGHGGERRRRARPESAAARCPTC